MTYGAVGRRITAGARLPLRDIAAALRHSPDESFVPQQRDRPARCRTAYPGQVRDLFLAGHDGSRPEGTGLDQAAQPCGDLPVRRFLAARVDDGRLLHRNKLEDRQRTRVCGHVPVRLETFGEATRV